MHNVKSIYSLIKRFVNGTIKCVGMWGMETVWHMC